METWRPIKEWNGKYFISDHGNIKSIGGKFKKQFPDGYISKGSVDSTGYLGFKLRRPGICVSVRIHVMVAEHFLVKPSWAECVNHLDGNKLNNFWKNLKWDTMDGNIKHAVETGLMDIKGEKHPNSILTEAKVIQMRTLIKTGLTHEKIGEMFGVCRRQAGDVIRGVNWGWLKEGL